MCTIFLLSFKKSLKFKRDNQYNAHVKEKVEITFIPIEWRKRSFCLETLIDLKFKKF